jgi:hypothetical protein
MPQDRPAPGVLCHCIGFNPNPLDFSPWQYVGDGRFDDPSLIATYRVLYTGDRRACFHETLVRYRASPLAGLPNTNVPRTWFDRRRIGTLRLDESAGSQTWLDLTSPVTYYDLDELFAGLLVERGITQFDLSTATSSDRALTQAIGRWAYRNGYHGIEYVSRHGVGLTCWAIFEGTPFVVHDVGSPIDWTDPDLLEVVRTWNIKLPEAFAARKDPGGTNAE